MRKTTTIFLLLMVCLTVGARKLQFLSVNHGKVHVGKHALKKGEKFDSKSTLKWDDLEQIMKVINLETRRVEFIPARTLTVAKINTPEDLLVKKTVLAARTGMLMTASDVEHYFNRQLILLSAISVETGFVLDDDHCFYLQYVHDGDTIRKRLPAANGRTFCIDDSIFIVDGQPLPSATLQARLYYYDRQAAQTMLMADSMIVNVEPRQACLQLLQACREWRLNAQETESIVADYCHAVFPLAETVDDDISRFCQLP